MLAGILHIVEAFILAESKAADTSIPIASLLDAFGGHRITLVATMLVSALLALTVAGRRDAVAAKGVQQRGDRDRGIGRFGFGEDKGFDDMQDRGAVDHHDSGRTLLQSAAPLICGWDDRRSPVRSPSR